MNKVLSFLILLLTSLTFLGCSPIDVQTSIAKKQQRYAQDTIKAAAISHDGNYSLIAENNQICFWDNIRNQKLFNCLKGKAAEFVELIGISRNNLYFYSSNQVTVRLYQRNNTKQGYSLVNEWFPDKNIINDIAISANGQKLLLGYRSGKAGIIDISTSTIQTYQNHRLDINSVALSDDGKLAFTGSSDKTAVLWSTETGEKKHSFKHRSRVNHVDISEDGSKAFTIDAIKDRFFWDLTTFKQQSELQTSLRFIEINHSSFSGDNQIFLSGSPKQKIQLWRTLDGELVGQWQSFQIGRSSVLAVTFIGSKNIATITSDGMYEIFPITTMKK